MNDPVQAMYDAIAPSYDALVDEEIGGPVYTRALTAIAEAVRDLPGPIVDLACGSGQMLQRYHAGFEPDRALVGLDLSPTMVAITARKLPEAQVRVGDMRAPDVSGAAALICWFALHHLDADQAAEALRVWSDRLSPGGMLSLATWEGTGTVDYGDAADIVAWRHPVDEVRAWVERAGLVVSHCVVEPVEGMGMDAVYLDARRG